MQRRSPPKHRHDGTSPLPLGMDWSPPPRKWNGRDTIWPHDHRTGWSYCVTIPSWIFLPKSRDSDPIVFYRVQIGLQSPEGITTTRGVLRRFNDFLKLFMDLKKSFPKKNLPPAPSKGLLRLKSRTLLEERKTSLEEWMTKLLSDLDLSRSMAVASFLELEAAARTSFQDANQEPTEASPTENSTSPLHQIPPTSSSSLTAGSSSVASDYGSDTAYEASESGTKDENYEIGIDDLTLDEDLTSPIEKLVKYGMSNIDEGLFLGRTILDELEGFPRHKPHSRYLNNVVDNGNHGNPSRASHIGSNGPDLYSGIEPVKLLGHTRKLSSESIGSDGSSLRGSEISNSGIPNSFGDGPVDFHGGAQLSSAADNIDSRELQNSNDAHIVLPVDQRHKMNRVLLTMQRRLATAKIDMDDLISRLNQEMAVKDFLATKVKALEVELEATKQKNKENLQQAITFEREKLTKMQWDMEELKRKSLEMELNLKSKEDGKLEIGPKVDTSDQEKDMLHEEMNVTRKQLENLSDRYEELEAKSKADIKYLAKEFKSLKGSYNEMKQELDQSLKEKSKLEKLLQEEREARRCEKNAQEKLLQDCRVLCDQLQDCKSNLPHKDEDATVEWRVADAIDVLSPGDNNSNNKTSLVLKALQLIEDGITATAEDDMMMATGELRTVLASIFSHHANLMKEVNDSVVYQASRRRTIAMNNDEAPAKNVNHVER